MLPGSANSLYQVHLEQFDGPLDLLLHLVRDAKLNITEISLAKVAKQYFAYIEHMQNLNIEIESSYLLVFAQLLELKSRLLLPPAEEALQLELDLFDNDEAPGADDPLVDRINAYALVKEAAQWLSEREAESFCSYPRPLAMTSDDKPELDVSLASLASAFNRLNKSARAPRPPVTLQKVGLSVPERIAQLWELFIKQPLARFTALLGKRPGKSMIIVTFLAILTLAKERKVKLTQNGTVQEIEITRIGPDESKS